MGYYSNFHISKDIIYSDIDGLIKLLIEINRKEDRNDIEDELLEAIDYGIKDLIKPKYPMKSLPIEWEINWIGAHADNKWYNDEKWVQMISPFIKEGELIFEGEDSPDFWGWRFKNGSVQKISYELTEVEKND